MHKLGLSSSYTRSLQLCVQTNAVWQEAADDLPHEMPLHVQSLPIILRETESHAAGAVPIGRACLERLHCSPVMARRQLRVHHAMLPTPHRLRENVSGLHVLTHSLDRLDPRLQGQVAAWTFRKFPMEGNAGADARSGCCVRSF